MHQEIAQLLKQILNCCLIDFFVQLLLRLFFLDVGKVKY